eukprot:tig00000254_g22523.t1
MKRPCNKEDFEACRARWQSELDDCVTKRGEQSLPSITYALRLARLLYQFNMKAEVRELFERFLAPRLLDERRRDELRGAASLESLANHVEIFGSICFMNKTFALSKHAFLV